MHKKISTDYNNSDGIACRILIQNELLEQVDTFPYLGSLVTEDGECTTEFRTRLNRGQAIEASHTHTHTRLTALFPGLPG